MIPSEHPAVTALAAGLLVLAALAAAEWVARRAAPESEPETFDPEQN